MHGTERRDSDAVARSLNPNRRLMALAVSEINGISDWVMSGCEREDFEIGSEGGKKEREKETFCEEDETDTIGGWRERID